MSRIFVSHSSNDNFAAVAVKRWLKEEGWDDVFLDPGQGIHPGQRWERALYEHASDCEVLLFLISRSWLNSDWCRREFDVARKLNKRILVVLIEEIPVGGLPDYLKETYQAVSLAAGEDHQVFDVTRPVTHERGHVTFSQEGLRRLKYGLTESGLDPRIFAWPPENDPRRAPYRGLDPLDGVDAGIFFGRDAPIIEVLDILRGLREGANPRLLVAGRVGRGQVIVTARIWDASAFTTRTRLFGHHGPINWAEYSSDGAYVLTAAAMGRQSSGTPEPTRN